MGNGASITRLDRLVERDVKTQKDSDDHLSELQLKHQEDFLKLETMLFDSEEQLRKASAELEICQRKLEKEQKKNISLMYSNLPMTVMRNVSTSIQFSLTYPMVTVAQCDVVNFSTLTSLLTPKDAITLIDQIQAAIDECLSHHDIFIMDRHADGCVAVCGMIDYQEAGRNDTADSGRYTEIGTSVSQADSLYDSEIAHNATPIAKNQKQTFDAESPSVQASIPPWSYASTLAMSVLKLMSISTDIHMPLVGKHQQQLQLRIAMNAGSCNSGIVNLQTTTGTLRIPHYKLFGQTISDTAQLCSSGLALQIRVTKQCHKLLMNAGGFRFERCPDFYSNAGKPVESYWLIGAEEFNYCLPSLDCAVSLSSYDDLL